MREYRSLRDMSDECLLKNHSRLVAKQIHIFSKKRSHAFQDIVQDYITKYQKEIKKRNLSPLQR